MITPVPVTSITPISEKTMKKIVAEISARDKKNGKGDCGTTSLHNWAKSETSSTL
jgi:hypothetical protein